MSFLNSLLLTLIKALHTLINNYALTIIVFTILIKLVVMPLNLKSRRSTMRMTTIQPKAAALQEKYKDCLLYTSPSPRDGLLSRMPSSA